MRKTLAVAAALLMIGSTHARADLINNGNFAAGGTGWTALQTYNPGASDSVEVHGSGVFGLSCYDATCNNMEVNANTFDTVTQTVNGLTLGHTYTLDHDRLRLNPFPCPIMV